jgi:dTDP-D-glucose 4,6-dehydratase
MPPRVWDTVSWVSDSAKIRTELGWAPAVSLEAGFTQTVDWLCANPGLWERYGVSSAPARAQVAD